MYVHVNVVSRRISGMYLHTYVSMHAYNMYIIVSVIRSPFQLSYCNRTYRSHDALRRYSYSATAHIHVRSLGMASYIRYIYYILYIYIYIYIYIIFPLASRVRNVKKTHL